jgi:pseudouridine-5'-phosphate glycosidase
MREALSIPGGQLIANPIPVDAEIPLEKILPIIRKANLEAKKDNIYAKDLTPFLLSKIFDYTQGASLKANIELVKNNARLACDIATSFLEEEKKF